MCSAELAKGHGLSHHDSTSGAVELRDDKLLSSPYFFTLPETTDTRAAYVPALYIMSFSLHSSPSLGPLAQPPQITPLNAASAHTAPPSQATHSAQNPTNILRPSSPQNQPVTHIPTYSQTAYQSQSHYLSGAGSPTTVAQIPHQLQNVPNTAISREEADLQPWR